MHEGRGGEIENSKVSGINGGKKVFWFLNSSHRAEEERRSNLFEQQKGEEICTKTKKREAWQTKNVVSSLAPCDYTCADLRTETRRDAERDKWSWQKQQKKRSFLCFQ